MRQRTLYLIYILQVVVIGATLYLLASDAHGEVLEPSVAVLQVVPDPIYRKTIRDGDWVSTVHARLGPPVVEAKRVVMDEFGLTVELIDAYAPDRTDPDWLLIFYDERGHVLGLERQGTPK